MDRANGNRGVHPSECFGLTNKTPLHPPLLEFNPTRSLVPWRLSILACRVRMSALRQVSYEKVMIVVFVPFKRLSVQQVAPVGIDPTPRSRAPRVTRTISPFRVIVVGVVVSLALAKYLVNIVVLASNPVRRNGLVAEIPLRKR